MSEINSMTTIRVCGFPGCGNKHYGMGLCEAHNLQRRLGKKLVPIRKMGLSRKRSNGSPPNIEYDESQCPNSELKGPCRIFKGVKDDGGYGHVSHNGKIIRVHRYAWELVHGPIPKHLVIDHKCRNRACCNVGHLRLVTRQINVTENVKGIGWQFQLAKTHCPQGHEYTKKDCKGHRICLICARDKARLYRLKAKNLRTIVT